MGADMAAAPRFEPRWRARLGHVGLDRWLMYLSRGYGVQLVEHR